MTAFRLSHIGRCALLAAGGAIASAVKSYLSNPPINLLLFDVEQDQRLADPIMPYSDESLRYVFARYVRSGEKDTTAQCSVARGAAVDVEQVEREEERDEEGKY